ncbi:MAG: MaoC family dehydratase N-terminal domain-containing protein, partial [Proteobacteria bacterium]|nr:MaoC family dehydratase N-terminal domain-containing protein [Pseudomonadota bacterium]
GRPGDPVVGDPLPPAWHMFYCLATDPPGALGSDGLPSAYEVIPELPLPRRMYAGSRMRFHAPIRIGDPIRLESELLSLESKQGRTGALIFATVINRVFGAGGELAIEEEYDVVAREAVPAGQTNPLPASEPVPAETAWRRTVSVDAVMLFRFSALVFNPHRIHYDRAHATGIEGYPGLVVHGPLHLILLLDLLRDEQPDRPIAALTMRAKAPLFDDAPVALAGRLTADGGGAELWTVTPTGGIATEVGVTFAAQAEA